jgi:hypothetical protein
VPRRRSRTQRYGSAIGALERGGILVPGALYQDTVPPEVNFSLFNGYYVSPLAINNEDGSVELVAGNKDEDETRKDPADPCAREYVTTQPSHPLPL